MNHFCTISTVSHLYKVYALAESLKRGSDFILHVLVIDGDKHYQFENCRFCTPAQLKHDDNAAAVMKQYRGNKDKQRWSMKPVFLHYLLQQPTIDKVIYLDNDLFFYSGYGFLFDQLDTASFLLTPHYYKADPKREQNWLEANYRVGLYNAGFVGVNKSAVDTLQWWADCCLYRCEKNAFRGLFDDQRYLDLIPVLNDKAQVLRHKGCNVASWNVELCPRIVAGDEVLIEGKFPIVFIHFNAFTIREIVNGADSALLNYYRTYVATLKRHNPGLNEADLLFDQPVTDKVKLGIWKIITRSGI